MNGAADQDKRPFESEKKNSVKEANNIHMYKYNAITSHYKLYKGSFIGFFIFRY